MIDGLSILLNLGVALSEVVLFVQACVQLLTSVHGPCQVSGYVGTTVQYIMVIFISGTYQEHF